MLFGEKYPDPVRMVSMGDVQPRTVRRHALGRTPARVGPFEILSEEGVSAGTRRIVALTGEKAQEHAAADAGRAGRRPPRRWAWACSRPRPPCRDLAQTVRDLKKQLAAGTRRRGGRSPAARPPPATAEPGYAEIKAALRDAARVLNVVAVRRARTDRRPAGGDRGPAAATGATRPDRRCCRPTRCWRRPRPSARRRSSWPRRRAANPNLMRQLIDQLRKKADSTAILFATAAADGRVTLIAGVSRDLVARGVSAGDWVRDVAARRRRRRRRQARHGPGRRQTARKTARRPRRRPHQNPGLAGIATLAK